MSAKHPAEMDAERVRRAFEMRAAIDAGREWWVVQLEAWSDDGTFRRMEAGHVHGQPVRVRRSSGRIVIGTLNALGGFGGREVVVEFFDSNTSEAQYKRVSTQEFLELNPGFGESYAELDPSNKLEQRDTRK